MKKLSFKQLKAKVRGCNSKIAAIGAAGAATIAASPAHAALDLTGVSVDTADYMTIAGFLVSALVGFWGVRKGLALIGR